MRTLSVGLLITLVCMTLAAASSDKTILVMNSWNTGWFKQFNSFRAPPAVVGLDRTHIVVDPVLKKNVLRIDFPKGSLGAKDGGAYWRTYLKTSSTHARISYDVMFAPGFDFVLGGKLPGVGGGHKKDEPDAFVAGGTKPTGIDGWSVRTMWRENGEVESYVYHVDQPGTYGHRKTWKLKGKPVRFVPGQWHRLTVEVQMNRPDSNDGVARAWFDGKPVLDEGKFRFRTIHALKVDSIHFATFFGGDQPSWAAKKDESVYFDNFELLNLEN